MRSILYRRYKRQGEWDGRDGGRAPPKRRIAPPPPPGFEDSPSPRGPKKRVAPPPPSPSRRGKPEEDGSASGSEACAVFKNFRVTIKNDSDGTPSLSDSDEEMDRKGKRKRKRKRKEREREKRKKLEKKLKKREEELKAVKEKRINSEIDLRDEIMQRRDESAGRSKKLSVIERLCERPPPGDRSDLRERRLGRDGERRGGPDARPRRSPIRVRASLEKSRREDLVRRAELRKDRPENSRDRGSLGKRNRSASPRKPRARLGSRSRGRRRGSLSLGRKSKSTGRRSRSPIGRSRSMGNRSKSRGNIRRNSKSKDRRSLSDLRRKRSLSKGRSASRNRRRRNRSRTPIRRAGDRRGNGGRGRRKKRKKKRKRGDLRRADKLRLEDMKEENEEMQAKLLEKRKKGGANQEGLLGRLAEMAGMGNLPDGFKSEDGKSRNPKSGSRSRSSSSEDSSHSSGSSSEDEYDSESGSESDDPKRGGRKRGNSGKRDKRFFWEKEGGKLKSDVVKKDGKNNGKSAKDKESEVKDLKDERSPDRKRSSTGKWKHDKFMENQLSPKKEREEAFGSHWSKIRSERSKERERNKSQSRSKSRTRSRSRSRSATPRRSRKRRRRGKFSRSRSSSESSRSRSWSSSRHSSYSSRSSTKSRSKSPTKKGPSPGTATTSKKAKDPEVVTVGDDNEGKDGKEGVNLGLSGALTAETNTVNGVVVKYCEPQEARKPKKKWRLYVFKGNEELPILYIHRQSAYLLGRDRKVADVPLDHPSCSKQHSALQFRLVPFTRPDGTQGRRVQLYVMDLNSANGTFVNNKKIESQKYIQLLEKDVLKFGFSSREYVLLHDQSKEDEDDQGVD